MVRENIVTPSNFIYPLFIHEEDFNTPIPSMPGCERHSLDSMLREVGESFELGVKTFVLFPKVPDHLKTNLGVEAYNPEGIVPRAIRMIKANYPDAVVVTDVALDPYSDQGHDGVVEDGKILNDVTINQLCKQVICQARAGADIVAPSDMMVCIIVVLPFLPSTHKFPIHHYFSTLNNRTDVSRPFVMPWIRRDSPMFPSFLTLLNMLLLTMGPSVMLWTATPDSVTRKLTSKTLPMDVKL
jgi:Delta-aminolevulinic acid dehydratase